MMDIDLLITNGNILTLDDNNNKARSLAVADGEIVGLWDSPEPPKDKVSITKETNTMDLQGASLIPGFIDTHNHILVYSLNKDKVDCSSPLNTCIADILTRIQSKVETTPAGEWIEGFSYDDTMLEEQRHPTKQELDTVAPDHPVYLKHITNHFAVANSKALEVAG